MLEIYGFVLDSWSPACMQSCSLTTLNHHPRYFIVQWFFKLARQNGSEWQTSVKNIVKRVTEAEISQIEEFLLIQFCFCKCFLKFLPSKLQTVKVYIFIFFSVLHLHVKDGFSAKTRTSTVVAPFCMLKKFSPACKKLLCNLWDGHFVYFRINE